MVILVGLAALGAAQASGADEKVIVMVPAVLDSHAPISDAAKRERNVDKNVATQVFERVAERYPGTEQATAVS